MVRLSALLSALFLVPAMAMAAEVELVLVDGQRLRGELKSEDESGVSLVILSLAKGEIRRTPAQIPANRIAKRIDLRPAAEEYQERRKALDGSPEGHFRLAQWCAERLLLDQAATEAQEGLMLDAGSAWGARIMEQIGWIRVDGRWISGAAHAAATGTVRWGDGFVSATEAEGRRRLAAAERERELAKAQVAELEAAAKVDPGAEERAAKAVEAAQKARENAAKALDKAEDALRETTSDTRQRTARVERRQAAANQVAEADAALARARREVPAARNRAAGAKEAATRLEVARQRLAKAEAAAIEARRLVPASTSATAAKGR
jgi:DNA repair exonuclease SbcCD ATPase subunit